MAFACSQEKKAWKETMESGRGHFLLSQTHYKRELQCQWSDSSSERELEKKNYVFFVSLMEQIYVLIGKSLLSAV